MGFKRYRLEKLIDKAVAEYRTNLEAINARIDGRGGYARYGLVTEHLWCALNDQRSYNMYWPPRAVAVMRHHDLRLAALLSAYSLLIEKQAEAYMAAGGDGGDNPLFAPAVILDEAPYLAPDADDGEEEPARDSATYGLLARIFERARCNYKEIANTLGMSLEEVAKEHERILAWQDAQRAACGGAS